MSTEPAAAQLAASACTARLDRARRLPAGLYARADRLDKSAEKAGKTLNLNFSLGLSIGKDAAVTSVMWDGAAFDQGITVGTTIVAIDGLAYSDDGMRDAIGATAKSHTAVKLLIKQGDLYRPIEIAYCGGLRYPRPVKVGKGDGSLDRLLAQLP